MWDRVTISAPPADVAVTLAEAKAFCDVTYSDDDDLITSLVAAATKKMDGPRGIGVGCFTQSWQLSLDCFPPWEIALPGWPVKSVTTVGYVDPDGASQTVDGADYLLDIGGDAARLTPAYNKSWPGTRAQNGAVTITYIVGEAQDDIAPELKVAIKMMVAHWYENREATIDRNHMPVPFGAEQIMRDFMRGTIAA